MAWWRSRQSGLSASIRAIFQSLRHFLISFSRRMASVTSPCISYQTRRSAPYLAEKPGMSLLFVLVGPAYDVVRDTQIKCPVPSACEQVDVIRQAMKPARSYQKLICIDRITSRESKVNESFWVFSGHAGDDAELSFCG